ncbi:hypothetical protein MKW94_009406 [Papaver nudicaule]|uniref:Uncharacterized protein n=1 Tax=Papaver nudicaule TaxID=74823 RepID=A0AA42AQE0_PAPNU|nr:hypothetical protein [Papaver nudicaule]
MAATKTPLSLIGLLFEASNCFNVGGSHLPDTRFSCAGALMRWRYSDDVAGDCRPWCRSLVDTDGVHCAQMNEDENHTVYCACYDTCVMHDGLF